MKRVKVYIICSFLSGIVIGIYITRVFIFQSSVKTPDIKIEPKSYNFGEVSPGKKVMHTFIIRNEGNRPLIITRVRRSCSQCTEIKLRKRVIPPHRETKMKVTFITPKFKTLIRSFIYLHTNDPDTPIERVFLYGKVTPDVYISPSILNFGIVEDKELPVIQKLIIFKKSHKKRENLPQIVISDNSRFSVQLESYTTNKWKLSLTLPKDFPIGPIYGDLSVKFNNSPHSFKIPILGKIIGDIYARPDELFFGVVDKSMEKKVEIHSRKYNIKDLKILSIVPLSLQKLLEVRIRKKGLLYFLWVRLKISDFYQQEKDFKGVINLKVITNKKIYKINIPILGKIKKKQKIQKH